MTRSIEERCTCCDLPKSMCGSAAERAQRQKRLQERTRLLKTPYSVQAAFAGRCASCGERYEAGSPIVKDDQAQGWRSLECCEVAR